MLLLYIEHQPKLKEGLSDNCIKACRHAKGIISKLCQDIEQGEVVVNDLIIAGKDINRILKLYDASSTFKRDEMAETLCALENTVTQRKNEYGRFTQSQQHLRHLCHFISEVKGKNIILFLVPFLTVEYQSCTPIVSAKCLK